MTNLEKLENAAGEVCYFASLLVSTYSGDVTKTVGYEQSGCESVDDYRRHLSSMMHIYMEQVEKLDRKLFE